MDATNKPNSQKARELMRYWALRWRAKGERLALEMAEGMRRASVDWKRAGN